MGQIAPRSRERGPGKRDFYPMQLARLDALSRQRALTDFESRQLERAVYHAG